MVVFVDLGDDDDTLPETRHDPVSARHLSKLQNLTTGDEDGAGKTLDDGRDDEDSRSETLRANPNLNGFSAALSCYPCVQVPLVLNNSL